LGRGTGGWDSASGLDPKDLAWLDDEITKIATNNWIRGAAMMRLSLSRDFVIFTDASDTRLGAVICDGAGSVLEVLSRRVPGSMMGLHIYLKEMKAATMFTMRMIRNLTKDNSQILLVVDNAAACFALSAFHSSNSISRAWLRTLHRSLKKHDLSFDCMLVVSADNPADDPSRGAGRLDNARFDRGWAAVRKYLAGLRAAGNHTPLAVVEIWTNRLRHVEPATALTGAPP
jgi:hypothetical protein